MTACGVTARGEVSQLPQRAKRQGALFANGLKFQHFVDKK